MVVELKHKRRSVGIHDDDYIRFIDDVSRVQGALTLLDPAGDIFEMIARASRYSERLSI